MWLTVLGKGRKQWTDFLEAPFAYYKVGRPPVIILFNMKPCKDCGILNRADSALTTDPASHIAGFGLNLWEGKLPPISCNHVRNYRRSNVCIAQQE